MEFVNGEKALEFNYEDFTDQELVDAYAHVWNHVFQFVHSMSLKCSVQLGIPDIIKNHGSPIPLSKLIDALPIITTAKSNCVHRLMRLLVNSKIFTKVNLPDGEEGYWLTPSSRLLLKDSPFCMGPFLRVVLDPFLTKPFEFLSQWLADDRPLTAFEMSNGVSFWEGAGANPWMNELFNEAMAGDSRFVSHVILKDSNKLFDGLESLVDVGGGTGTMAKAVAEAYPGMKCMVLDLPHVVAGLEDVGNLTFVGGDMLENIPAADAVLLKWILHDWSDEDCVKILKNSRNAISGGGGKVIVVDMVVKDGTGKGAGDASEVKEEDKLLFDIAMMVYVNGKERSEKEWEKLFLEAGFSNYQITPAVGVRSIIEVYP